MVGLTSALVLARAGLRVTVVADRSGPATSSRVAGAIWFPYQVETGSAPARWARETYGWLRREAGGALPPRPFYLLASEGGEAAERPAWRAALPEEVEVAWRRVDALPALVRRHGRLTGAAGAWVFEAPIVDPAAHLAWLQSQLAGCAFEDRRVDSLAELARDAGVVVNCTGRRARALTGDGELQPARGQIAVASGEHLPAEYAFVDDRDPGRLTYLIPRRGAVVLGGHAGEHDPRERAAWESADAPAPDAELGRRIRERFERAGLAPLQEVTDGAEWRPIRRGGVVRLEREGRIVHNYGHGGSGFTLAYGCALAVRELVTGV